MGCITTPPPRIRALPRLVGAPEFIPVAVVIGFRQAAEVSQLLLNLSAAMGAQRLEDGYFFAQNVELVRL